MSAFLCLLDDIYLLLDPLSSLLLILKTQMQSFGTRQSTRQRAGGRRLPHISGLVRKGI